jgi:hypothetical protein
MTEHELAQFLEQSRQAMEVGIDETPEWRVLVTVTMEDCVAAHIAEQVFQALWVSALVIILAIDQFLPVRSLDPLVVEFQAGKLEADQPHQHRAGQRKQDRHPHQ